MGWLRLYDDVVHDPKVQRLPAELFKAWINLLCLANKCNGTLRFIDDIAYELRQAPEQVREVLDELVERGLLDHKDGNYAPHNWLKRQYKSDSSTERVKRFRKRQRNVSRNGGETPRQRSTKRKRNVTETHQNRTEQNRPSEGLSGSTEASLPSNQKSPLQAGAAGSKPDFDLAGADEKALFARGKQVLGDTSGGLIVKLLRHCDRSVPMARSFIERASTKATPREYVGRIIAGYSDDDASVPIGIPGIDYPTPGDPPGFSGR